MSEDHAKLEKIAALLRHAEKASTEQEAAAFFSKAQTLCTQNSIDLELARQHATKGMRIPVLETRMIKLGERRQKGLHTYVKLFSSIATANDVNCDISQNSTYIWAYGFDTDIDMTVTLFTSLLQQMVQASTAYLETGDFKNETVWREARYRQPTKSEIEDYGYPRWQEVYEPASKVPVHGSTARISFQEAYAMRVGSRLYAARTAAREAAQEHFQQEALQHPEQPLPDSVSLVLVRKADAVQDYYKSKSDARGSYRGGTTTARSRTAREAGREAGSRARIGAATSVGGSRKALAS